MLFLLALVAAACNSTQNTLVVSVAASLTDAFEEVESRFEALHPDVDVQLNIGGTPTLREQILEGAPIDVFASADPSAMVAIAELLNGDSEAFASNQAVIAVPESNPREVSDLADLGDPNLLVGLCAEPVPCGTLAVAAFDRAGVTPSVDTYEADVRSLVTKLETGDLDVGIVYVTDVAGSALLTGIDIGGFSTVYEIAVLADAPHPVAAAEFVAFVTSEEGRSILTDFGFGPP